MNPYNNNILIIDDKISELQAEIIEPLERMNFYIEKQPNPESGLCLASHRFSVIFIDFQFDFFPNINGAILCEKIRKKCPLSTLILITGYNRGHFEQFSHAPWDGGFEKGKLGERPSQLDIQIKECLNKSIKSRYDKIPLLSIVPNEREMITEKIRILDKLQSLYEMNKNAKHYDDTAVATELGYKNRSALSQKFTPRNCDTGELKKEALIFRHIIMNEPSKWELAKKHYSPLSHLLEFFSI